MWTIIKDFLSGKKVMYAVLTFAVETILGYVRTRFPDVTLPSTEQVLALGAGLIACHTLTDVVAIVKDAIVAYAQTPKPATDLLKSVTSAMTAALDAKPK